jgi:pimeloyl-ACP methyl ester carboxylesterase
VKRISANDPGQLQPSRTGSTQREPATASRRMSVAQRLAMTPRASAFLSTLKDPAAPANRKAWASLGEWDKPFLTLFGAQDPILSKFDEPLRAHVPGSLGQPHARLQGNHFVQDDAGVDIARPTLDWIGAPLS